MKTKLLVSMVVLGLIEIIVAKSAFAQVGIGQTNVLRGQYGASANWDESHEGKAVIQIPRGWAVIGTKDERSSNFGRTSLNVSYVQEEGHFASYSEVESRFREVSDHMFKVGNISGQRKAQDEKNRWLSARNNIASSHAAVIVQVRASGNGNFVDRKGGSIQGTYLVTVRYIGTPADLSSAVSQVLANTPAPPPAPKVAKTLVFPTGGRVTQQADGNWVEIGANGQFVCRFRQLSQDANTLVLREDARRFTLTIPKNGGQILWQNDGKARLPWGNVRWE